MNNRLNPIFCGILLLSILLTATDARAQFQKIYGDAGSNNFTRVVPDGADFYVLGTDNGAATVTRILGTGAWQWTRVLPFPSGWTDGVVDPATGNLHLVGFTLPFNSSNQSLIGEIDAGGVFQCIKKLDGPGTEALARIDRSPTGNFLAVGFHTLLGQVDVVIYELGANCTVNSKKQFFSASSQHFYNDILVLPNSDFLVAGQTGNSGVIYQTDAGGNFVNGVSEPSQFSYVDLARAANGDILAVGNYSSNLSPRIVRFDASLLVRWEAQIFGLNSLDQVFEAPNGDVYALGTETVNNLNRAVLFRIDDAGGSGPPTLLPWNHHGRFLDNGETGYLGGAMALTGAGDIAFVDGRDGAINSFGQTDAFFALTGDDLLSECTDSLPAELILSNTFFTGPEGFPLFMSEFPVETPEVYGDLMYDEAGNCGEATADCEPWTVATCYGEFPSSPVGVIYDTRFNSQAPPGDDWGNYAPPVPEIHPPAWTVANMGNVFGIALDGKDKIYLAASDVYTYDKPALVSYVGPGGPAGVYKTDFVAPSYPTTNITSTVALPSLPAISGNQLPNMGAIGNGNGNGIGNIAYDPVNKQLFLTNLEDGRIYRLSTSGTLLSAYDPFALDSGLPGLEEIDSERIWGIAVYTENGVTRVYFARERGGANPKQIWSIALDNTGEFDSPGTATPGLFNNSPHEILEINNLPGTQEKITDLAFAEDGRLLMTERGAPHDAMVFDYTKNPWTFNRKYFVGGSNGQNGGGGIDYGYVEKSGNPLIFCDSMVWSTGNCLMVNAITASLGGCDVYGLEGMSVSANAAFPANSIQDIFIDFDHTYAVQQKQEVGDVEVFRCGCLPTSSPPCDSLMVMIAPDQGDLCCYTVDLKNNFGPSISKIQLDLQTPGVIFNTSQINTAAGFQYAASNSDQTLCITHTSGSIPAGLSVGALRFCYSGVDMPGEFPQTIQFTWWQNVGGAEVPTECKETFVTDCPPEPVKDTCILVTPLQIDCNPDNVYEYILTFKVTNLSSIPAFNAYTVNLYGLPAGFFFSPCTGTALLSNIGLPIPGAPLAPGQMSGNMCVKIISTTPILNPQTICAQAKLIGLEACCTTDDKFCVTLEPCCDPCENIAIVATPVQPTGADCCYSLGIENDCPYPFFSKVEAEITTPGVTYGYYGLNAPYLGTWSLLGSSNTKLCIRPNIGTVPGGSISNLVNFCLDNINNPSQVPQQIVIRWLTPDINGVDSVACDTTLIFDCEFPTNYDCLAIDSIQIECQPDANKYLLTFTVTNLSLIPFAATQLDLIQVAPPDLVFFPSSSIPLVPPLSTGQSQTVSICLLDTDGLPGSGNLIFFPKLTFMMEDTCCYEPIAIEVPLPPCDTCICAPPDIVLTQNGIDYQLFCAQGPPTPVIPCPAADVTISGFFGCENPDTGELCDETTVSWSLSGPGGFCCSGTTTNFPLLTFPAATVDDPGTYFLTYSTLCPGAVDSCVCTVRWIQEECDSCCIDLDTFCQVVENAVSVVVDNDACKVTLNIGDLPDCDLISNIGWGDGSFDPGPYPGPSMPMHTYAGSGTYVLTWLATESDPNTGLICFEKGLKDTINLVCDTCFCGGFSDMFIRWGKGGQYQQVFCDTTAVTLPCPDPGKGYALTGVFKCQGMCPDDHDIDWTLSGPGGTFSNSFSDNDQYFGVHLLPTYFTQPGLYTLTLNGTCGGQVCTCVIQFNVDCPNLCPCNADDIIALQDHVDKGFAYALSTTTCKACFSPIAVSACETVEWYLNSTSGTPIGTSNGKQTFCTTFTSAGTYTVYMVVTRKKPDGTLCETFTKSQQITVTCGNWPECEVSVLENPNFNVNPVAGGLALIGSAPGWTAAEGDPTLLEGQPPANTQDGWSMLLRGNYDEGDVLASAEPICLSKADSGMLSMRIIGDPGTPGDPIPGRDVKVGRKPPGGGLAIQLYTGASAPYPECTDGSCYDLATLEDLLPLDTMDWYELRIPYDLSDWSALDSCGDGSGGLPVRLAVYVYNDLSDVQGEGPTRDFVEIDNLCLNGLLVGTEDQRVDPRNIQLFPNPTTGDLTVRFAGTPLRAGNMQIVDLWGRIVAKEVLPPGQQEYTSSIAALPAGVYFVRVLEDGLPVWSQRVVKH